MSNILIIEPWYVLQCLKDRFFEGGGHPVKNEYYILLKTVHIILLNAYCKHKSSAKLVLVFI